MPCYYPLQGYLSRSLNKSGKRSVVFNHREGFIDLPVKVPCGQCIGCRLERSRQWAVRCVHEASLYDENCFITLTYDNEHLDKNGSLVKADFQKFMKRLRKRFGSGVRYYHCGEYGEVNMRPHHHACLFNFNFGDRVPLDLSYSSNDLPALYVSNDLAELWPFGIHTIGDVTFESAAYVARYVMKKITGERADSHYNGRLPEYTTMSRRPGIGRQWFDKFKGDCYPSDELVIRGGVVSKPPRYYDELYFGEDSKTMNLIKGRRLKCAKSNIHNSGQRLSVRCKVTEAKCKTFLKRSIEI